MQHAKGEAKSHPGLLNKQKWLHSCIEKIEVYVWTEVSN